ncbi:dentin sialophosphoprotein isoform X1 [Spatholobus suberectus]|nr:dentin sialophosphoprotein isoform X1 [Spatholobus suberectus]
MDNQDQRRTNTHTQGHESHGVHACHKCGWPFPNPHPSSKQTRAHKKVCGTIHGYKPLFSERQTHSNASDDEHLSEDDPPTQGPNSLDTGNNEKLNGGTGEILTRSGDEVFLDAIANFSDSALSPGSKEPLRDSLDSATDAEIVNGKYQEFSGSSDFNDDGQMQDPSILHGERVKDGNMLELQGQLSGSHVDPLSSSITDLRTVVRSDDFFGLSSDSNSSKLEATPDLSLENKFHSGENVRRCSLASVAKETDLKENDEIKSDTGRIDIVVFSNNIVGDTHEGILKIAVSDVVNSDCQVARGAFNQEEKNNVEFLSVIPQEELSLEVNSILSTNTSTNGVQVESAHMIQFATSGDVKMSQEMGEGNVNLFTSPLCGDRADVAHPQNECADFKDHKGVLPQNSLSLLSSEAWKPKQDNLKDSDDEENNFLINQSQLNEKREVLPPDGCVSDSSMKEQESCELVAEEMHAEECIEGFSVKSMIESDKRSDETGASMNALKTEMNENYMIHFSEERGSDGVHKNSQQISLPECSFMAASKENPSDTSFGGSTTETTSVISVDYVNHHEESIKEITSIAVDDKCRGANVENDIGISMKTLQLSNLHLEVNPSSGVYRSDDVVEMGKFEKCDISITDAQYMERSIVKDSSLPKPAGNNFECPILSEVVMDRSARTPKGIECANRGPLSDVQEDIKDDEINSSCRVNKEWNGFISTSADSHQTQDAELLVKAAEDLCRNYSSLYSLNVEPSVQWVSVVEDTQGEHGGEVSGIAAVPVQDRSDNNKVQLPSSAIYTSIDYGIQCDSLEGNRGSVSGVTDVEGLPSTDLVRSTEAGKSNLKDPKAASKRQQCETPEVFEPPSFMTLVEPGHVVAASEVQNGLNQHPSSTSLQAGWFPTQTQVTNESQGRKRNKEIIAKISNYRTSKQHTPLQSPLGEAAHSNKPKSPKLEENSMIRKDGESPAAKAVKGEGGKGWNSPARYPSDIKRQNKKVKRKPYWMPFVCCSFVDSPRR